MSAYSPSISEIAGTGPEDRGFREEVAGKGCGTEQAPDGQTPAQGGLHPRCRFALQSAGVRLPVPHLTPLVRSPPKRRGIDCARVRRRAVSESNTCLDVPQARWGAGQRKIRSRPPPMCGYANRLRTKSSWEQQLQYGLHCAASRTPPEPHPSSERRDLRIRNDTGARVLNANGMRATRQLLWSSTDKVRLNRLFLVLRPSCVRHRSVLTTVTASGAGR